MAYTTKKSKIVEEGLEFSCALSKSKSLPTSPDPDKKNVHFADAEGKVLANIKTYVPSYDDLDALKNACLVRERASSDHNKEAGATNARFAGLQGSTARLRPFAISQNCGLNVGCLSLGFDLPTRDEVTKKLQQCHIVLEDVLMDARTIRGQIIVNNIAYEKEIFVRHTFDNWASIHEVPATYIPFSSYKDTDRFMFSITLPKSCRALFFALRYLVIGKEFWDNNGGNNYKVADFS